MKIHLMFETFGNTGTIVLAYTAFDSIDQINISGSTENIKIWIANNQLCHLPFREAYNQTSPDDLEYVLTEKQSALFLLTFK